MHTEKGRKVALELLVGRSLLVLLHLLGDVSHSIKQTFRNDCKSMCDGLCVCVCTLLEMLVINDFMSMFVGQLF